MATASRTFRRQVAKKKVARPVVDFFLTWVDDEDPEKVIREDVFHATAPTDERLFLLAAAAGDEDGSVATESAAIMDLFRDVLPPDEFRTLRSRLKDPEDDVDLEMLQDVTAWLMEEWSTFPTEPSSASSTSRPRTGTRSTGRVRGPGSTRSD